MDLTDLIDQYKARKKRYASKEEIQKRIDKLHEIECSKNLSVETRNWASKIIVRLQKLLK